MHVLPTPVQFLILSLLAMLALLGLPLQSANAQSDVVFKGDYQKFFKAGEAVILRLPMAEGTFAQMQFASEGGGFTIDLKRGDGSHVRRFLDQGKGRKRALFVAPTDDPLLHIQAKSEGRLSLKQLLSIGKEKQGKPAPTLLSKRLSALAHHVSEGGDTAAFWADIEAEGTPMVENREDGNAVLTFLARGAKNNVRLWGGPSNDLYSLTRLSDSDVWYRSVIVPDGTFFSYQLAPDTPEFDGPARLRRIAILAKAQADPFNKYPWPQEAMDGFNQKSTFRVGNHSAPSWLSDHGAPKGTLTHHTVTSAPLGNSRDVAIYLTDGFDRTNPDTPFLFVFDGQDYLAEGKLTTSIDNLVAIGALPPLAVIFVSAIDLPLRAAELPDNDAFADFMANEVRDLAISVAGMTPKAQKSILTGSSFGGLGSTTIALKHPEAFGMVLSLSGSYWWSPQGPFTGDNYVANTLLNRATSGDIVFYLSAGRFETPRGNDFSSILLPNRHLRDVLRAKGYQVTFEEFPTAHDMFAWREILPQGLLHLIGTTKSVP